MVYQLRGRSRTNSGSFRGRGKPFRGRGRDGNKGQGLLITLNSRSDSQNSWDDRPISNKHDMSRRDNTNYEGSYEDSHDYVQSFEKRRKMEDDYDRNRSLDKIDLSAESESLRITFGNERFHREMEQSPMRSAPLSERLGPPVDNSPSGSGSRYRDKDTYADDGSHDRSRRESLWYNRQERERTEKSYIEKRDQHDYRQYDRTGRSPEHHDWKSSSSFNRSSSNSDHGPRDDSRYDKREGRYRDDRSSRERYNRDDVRNKERKHGRYDDAERDRQHRRDYPREFSGRDDSSRNSVRSRHSSIDSSERDRYQDDFDRDSDRRKRDSIERSHESVTRHGGKSESSRYSPERYKDSPRSESEIFRYDISNPDQKLHPTAERPLFSARMDEILDSTIVSQTSAKPLKSILKKKSEPSVDQPDKGNQSSFDSQVTDFLKSLQSPMTRATDIQDNFNIISNSSFETTQEMKASTIHVQGRKLDLTIGSQPLGCEMDVDDEEEFLYGQKSRLSQQSHQDALFPVVESNPPRSESRPKQSLISENVDKDSSIHSVSSANLPSWMRPLYKQDEVETEKKDDDMDKTVQNILKSIGFNFDLSKRMQELAKLKKQKEEEAQFPINKNASFLGAGISSADLKAKLFSTEGKTTAEEKGTRRRSSEETAVETRHKPFTTDHTSSGQRLNRDISSRDIRLSDDSDVICSTSMASIYTNQHTPSNLQVSQEKSPVSQFHAQPTPYPSYPEPYHHTFNHALPKEHMHMMPPTNPNYHVPMPYNYMSYPPPGFPHAVPHDVPPHLQMPHPPQPPHKAKRSSGSSNLTVIPLSTIGKKAERKNSEDEGKNLAKKREREKSPEYSRIVIAPKSKETRDNSPVRKSLKQQKEEDKEKRIKPRPPKEVTEVAVKAERTDNRSVKQEPKLPPVSAREQQSLLKESEERKKKLMLLEKELGKLKKHQNEIMRRRQRQRDGHKDPLLVQNSKLQEEITAQIRMLRKASETSSNLLNKDVGKKYSTPPSMATEESVKEDTKGNSKEEKGKSTQGSSPQRHEFYDPGNHWCGVCNYVSPSLLDHLTHLQSRKHKQKCDPYDRPWLSETLNEKKLDKAGSVEITALKGVEFLMSTDAFYCTLCRAFTGDVSCAEAHIKSEEHYMKYKSHIKQNEFYEKRYTLEKTAALSHVKETSEQRKGSEVREITRAKRSTEDREEENNSDKDTCKTRNLIEKKKEIRDNSCSEREVDQLKDDDDNDDELENSKDDNESMDLSEDSKNGDSQTVNSSKNQKVEKDEQKDDLKQEEASKGKIAIKLTGKTGIKPQSKVLPPWTPVTKKLQTVKIKKTEIVPQKKAISKPENDPPSSLDTFLTIGGLTTKKLPVYKLRSGTVKKPLNKRAVSPEKKQPDGKDSEEMEDMKLMGIECSSSQIAPKKAPPPRSQNLSLPKEGSSQSSSSAQELYTVFYQDVSEERSMYDINLDDIPIPPPPPQPPVPYKEISSEIPLPSGNKISASSGSNLSPDIAVTCQTTLNEEGKTQKSEAIPIVKDIVEDSVKTDGFPDTVVSGTSDTEEKSGGLVVKKDDTCLVVVEVCTPDNEGSKAHSDGTNDTEKLENVTEKKEDQCIEKIDVCASSGEENKVKNDGTNETEVNSEEPVDKKEVSCLNMEDSTTLGEGNKVQSDDTNETGEKSDKKEDIPSENVETLVLCEESEVQSDGTKDTDVKSNKKEDISSENVETIVPCGEDSKVQSVGTNNTEDKSNKKDNTSSEEVEALVPCTEESKVQSEDTSYTEDKSDKEDHICSEEVKASATSGEMRMIQCDGTDDAEEKSDNKEDICSVEFDTSITTDEVSKVQSATTGLEMENTSGDEVNEISQHLMLVDSPANMQVTMALVDSINQIESHHVKSESENICESVDSSDLSVKASDLSSMMLPDKSTEEKLTLPSETEDISTREAEKADNELCLLSSDVKCPDVLGEEEEPSSTVNSPVAEETGECAKENDDIADDCASVCSGSSILMGSDFEVVDEYEAD